MSGNISIGKTIGKYVPITYSADKSGNNVSLLQSPDLIHWTPVKNSTISADGKTKTVLFDTTAYTSCFFNIDVSLDSPLIADPNLETAIRTNLGIDSATPLNTTNLKTITTLNLNDMGITTLDGIENLTGLTSISLSGNPIIDYSKLLPTTTADLSQLVAMKSVLNPNNRDHFSQPTAPFYIPANTVDSSITGTLVKYVHPDYNGLIHTEGQWYAGFQLAEKGVTSGLSPEQQTLMNNIITAGTTYFPKLTINGQETTLQSWMKNDNTSAADADVFRITTLKLTGRTADAKIASDDFFKYETKEIQGLTVPLCGVNDTSVKLFDSPFYTIKGNKTAFIWNPSYSYSYAANALSELDPKWSNLQRTQNLINSKVLDAYGLLDWCVVLVDNNTGEITVSSDLDTYFPRNKVDSFHINQIFSKTIYANNWREKNIFTEDANGYLTYQSDATTKILTLIYSIPSDTTNAEREATLTALIALLTNSQQQFPGRGGNINNTEQKEWPRFIMDHLMNYAKYKDTSSLAVLNKIIDIHGFDLNGLLYYGWPNEIVVALKTALKATFNKLSPADILEFNDQVLTLNDGPGNEWYGNKWYIIGKDWTFNQFIVGMIVNTSLQKIKLP